MIFESGDGARLILVKWLDRPAPAVGELVLGARSSEIETLFARAQAAGAVRPELVYEDVVVLFWSLRGVIEATAAVSPDAWMRHLELLLYSVVPGSGRLTHPPLTADQVRRAKEAAVLHDSPATPRPRVRATHSD